ncbi:MAG: NUDIX domain-containing protein [bacterium]
MSRPVTPLLTVDIVVRVDRRDDAIVLIERKFPPLGWALPGGFVDVGETLEQAAMREAREEICLDVRLDALLGCYSNPDRDKRGHTVSAVYIASASGIPRAADDAKNVIVSSVDDLALSLAFDHGTIVEDYRRWLDVGQVAPLR